MWLELSPSAQQTLDRLVSDFPRDLERLAVAAGYTLAHNIILPEARIGARGFKFEGDLLRDLGIQGWERVGGGVSIFIGESGRLFAFTEGDPLDGPDPFSYPLAKDQGAKPHRVFIYDRRTFGSGSLARQKLRRYYEKVVGDLPDTYAEFKEMNADRVAAGGKGVSPFINVDPGRTGRSFLTGLIAENRVSFLADFFKYYVKQGLRSIWH